MKKPVQIQNGTCTATTPSIIGNDVKIVGNITTQGELQLDGHITGDLRCGSLVMGETGSAEGTIITDTAIIRGRVSGEIRARSVRLEQTSLIEGDVIHETLSVEAGANLTGRFKHTSDPVKQKVAAEPTAKSSEIPSFVADKKAAE